MTAVPEGGPRPAGVVEAYAVMMREQIAPALRELGFKGSSGTFTMRRDGAHGEIRFQKDGRSVRGQILPFTVEVGYWCGQTASARCCPCRGGTPGGS
jgi:hypothetical protein